MLDTAVSNRILKVGTSFHLGLPISEKPASGILINFHPVGIPSDSVAVTTILSGRSIGILGKTVALK